MRANAPPASVFVRVPLPWLQSTTYAFQPDETHSLIRRSYTPRHDPASKRFFCGVCAELLSVWTEANASDQDYMHINWHTLEANSREQLELLGLLPKDALPSTGAQPDPEDTGHEAPEDADSAREVKQTPVVHTVVPDSTGSPPLSVDAVRMGSGERLHREMPWFDEMLEGSPLGRMRRRKGGGVSADGRTRVEWEIVEYGGDVEESDPDTRPATKRQMGNDDVAMREAH